MLNKHLFTKVFLSWVVLISAFNREIFINRLIEQNFD